MCDSLRGHKDGCVIIEFKDFHLYKISSLLREWKYVVVSDIVVDESIKIQLDRSGSRLSPKECIEKIMRPEKIPGRGEGDPIFLYGLPDNYALSMWAMGSSNRGKQDIVIGPCESKDGSWISNKTIQEIFINDPKHFMSIEITNDDTDALN